MSGKALLIVCLVVFAAGAAQQPSYQNGIEVEVPPIFIADLNISYECALSELFSMRFSADIAPVGSLALEMGEQSYGTRSDYGVYAACGIYPVAPMRALFFEFYGAYYQIHRKYEDDYHHLPANTSTVLAPGLMLGWKWQVADRASIRLGGGSAYDTEADAVRPRISAALGLMF